MSDYKCERCFAIFKEKKTLIKHLHRINVCIPIGSNTSPDEIIYQLTKKENGVKCEKCNRIYKNNNSLRTHKCKEMSRFKLLNEIKAEIKNQKNNIMLISDSIKRKNEEINDLKKQYQVLLTKHTKTLKRHQYVKFNDSSPCFYIIENPSNNTQYKFGIAGTDDTSTIDERLKSHRTLWPLLKVRYLLFIKDVNMIEKSFKMMYDKEINPNGHEIIEGVLLDDMKKRIQQLLDILSINDYSFVSNEKLKEYNEYVDMTCKSNPLCMAVKTFE
jgi:hypothetical protein